MKILCVDEDRVTLQQLENHFANKGYTIHGVHDTLSAIEELERHLDFNLMICEFSLAPTTVEPIFWHLSVNNYSLSTIIYCRRNSDDVKNMIQYPDLITVIEKPDLSRLCECVSAYKHLLMQASKSGLPSV